MHPTTRIRALLERAASGLAVVAAGAGAAAAPDATPRRIPELYVKFELADPAQPRLDVQGRIQHATAESLDLVRWDPGRSRLPRLEVWLGADGFVLHPRRMQPTSYRTPVPRGAPLEYHYVLSMARADSIPHVWGADHGCVWLGSTVLAPRFIAENSSSGGAPAVERLLAGAALPLKWKLWTPWPERGGLAFPADLDDATDNFIGFGIWRSHTEIVQGASPCTLTTSIAGSFGLADSAWVRIVRETFLPRLPELHLGRAWVGIAPGETARGWIARRSALVVCAADSLPPGTWPAARLTRTGRARVP